MTTPPRARAAAGEDAARRAGRAPPRDRRWKRLRQLLPWLLAALVLALLAHQALSIEWQSVGAALRSLPTTRIALAAALGLLSHALYAGFDLVSRNCLGHGVGVPRTALIALTSYAFNLNFGALLGGMALRLRLYTRAGATPAVAAKVIAWSMASNWLGYGLTTGLVLALAPPLLPASWPLPAGALRGIGALLLALALGWLSLCARSRRGDLRWRGQRLPLPSLRVALLQALLSGANWLLLGAIIWLLLDGAVDYPTTLATLQLAAVAGVVTHVPAGLGVLEAVFLATLGGRVPEAQLLAALLAYRAVYYLLPLAWAVPGYLVGEGRRVARVDV